MKIHELKIWTNAYEAWERGEKTCEIRDNDRDFLVGDIIVMIPFNPLTKKYLGALEPIICKVTRIDCIGMTKGYVALSLSRARFDS